MLCLSCLKSFTKNVKYLNAAAFVRKTTGDTMKNKPLLSNFDSVLSPLEADVLNILWPDKSMRVREIYARLRGRRKVALSSVAVILDRLHERSIVERKVETGRGGMRYIYAPKNDQKGFEKSVIENTVNTLMDKFGSTAISYFNERFAKR